MKKWLILFFTCLLIFSLQTASADVGPKPKLKLEFENFPSSQSQTCYITLLSKYNSTGPHTAYNGTNARYEEETQMIWEKFLEYKDSDGFYFLQYYEWLEDNWYQWSYHPPKTFKVLLYFPESDVFVVSDIYERYAFDTYYKVVVTEGENPSAMHIRLEKNYQYKNEFVFFAIRVVLTCLIELAIARMFGFTDKKAMRFIILLNFITQIGLNVLANFAYLYCSGDVFMAMYMMLELAVMMVEMVFYTIRLPKYDARAKSTVRIIAYTLCANVVSFMLGLFLSFSLPQIF